MAWKRKHIEEPDRPLKIPLYKWLLTFLILSAFLLLLFYLFRDEIIRDNVTLLILFSPLTLCLFLFCLQIYFYARAMQNYTVIMHNINNINTEWEKWGGRYVSVLGSKLFLPGEVDGSSLSDNQSEVMYGLAVRIDYFRWETNDWFSFFTLLIDENDIFNLPVRIAKEFIILMDCNEREYTRMEADFSRVLEEMNIMLPSGSVRLVPSLLFEQLDAWLKVTEEKIYIVLVLQLNGKENYSDGIVSFLFAADDVVKKYQLDEKARIFRPMVVVADRFDKDLDIFIDTQKIARNATGLTGDCAGLLPVSGSILQCFNEKEGKLQVDNIHVMESLSGLPGLNSVWLTAALAVSAASYQKSDYLMMARYEDDWIITTVHPVEAS